MESARRRVSHKAVSPPRSHIYAATRGIVRVDQLTSACQVRSSLSVCIKFMITYNYVFEGADDGDRRLTTEKNKKLLSACTRQRPTSMLEAFPPIHFRSVSLCSPSKFLHHE